MTTRTSIPPVEWKRPTVTVHKRTGYRWRHWVSRCGEFRIAHRIEGPPPLRWYAEYKSNLFDGWDLVDCGHRTKSAAIKACEHMRRARAEE